MGQNTVIITGGTRGLGRELSLAFARAGAMIVALYHADDTAAQELGARLQSEGLNGKIVKHDVTSDAEGAAIWNLPEIKDAPHLTLIHNACASFEPRPLHLLEWEDFQHNLNVAVKGAWSSSRAVIRQMVRDQRGTIVTVLSDAVHGASPKGFAAYSTAKHALRGFTQALATEYSPRGVRVFSVSPGFMETSLTAGWDPRLRDGIKGAGARCSDTIAVAAKLVALVNDAQVPGQGEDYPV